MLMHQSITGAKMFCRRFSLVSATTFALSLLLTGGAGEAVADTSATASAQARIVQPLNISALNKVLSFGAFIPTDSSGTVTMDPTVGIGTDPRSFSNVDEFPSDDTSGLAVFQVTGDEDESFVVTLPSTVILSDGGSNTMEVTVLTSYANPPGASGSAGISLSGSQPVTVRVGGELSVAANQAPGEYESGSFDVTVSYQ